MKQWAEASYPNRTPLLEDWRWTEFDRRGLSLRDADRYLWARSFADDLREQIAAGFER